ncbi:MAG TPA: hypothetical protein PK263_00105 [bacterium]|nr:hypothetical protein [bacterium]
MNSEFGQQGIDPKELGQEKEITQLSNDELLRLTLVKLGGIHSSGGASTNRSIRSNFREYAITLLTLGDESGEDYYFDPETVIDEALRRSHTVPLQGKLFNREAIPDVRAIPDRWLAAELLHHLYRWYQKDARESDAPLSNFERRLSLAACQLLPLEYGQPIFTKEKVLHEAKNRISDYNSRDAMISLGNNPYQR